VLALAIIVLFGLGLAHDLTQPAKLCPSSSPGCSEGEAVARLAQLGFPVWYAAFVSVLQNVLVPLGYLIVALVIFWRARDSWLGLGTTVVLVIYPLWANTDVFDNLADRAGGGPGWVLLGATLDFMLISAVAFLLFTFPTGRFGRRWMAGVVAVALLLHLASDNFLPRAFGTFVLLFILVAGLAYQIYRYRRVSSPIQRQQTKWVLAGLAGFIANAVIWFAFVETAIQRGTSGVWAIAIFAPLNAVLALSLPVALGISILRYRLWDIDVIIRRTLIYSALTATLAVVYLGSVLILQSLLRLLTGNAQNQLVTVISTLAIAALFIPVRAYVQSAIDRRFYRGKYDAARTLSDFSAAARDEVELARLTDDLVNVVDKTMQPAQITLWLRPGAELHN
jgi:hypothetical protein